MQIVVLANDEQITELSKKNKKENAEFKYIKEYAELSDYPNADAFFILMNEINIAAISLIAKPLFIHSVIQTLSEINLPGNVSRINAWPTFLQRDVWEIATINEVIAADIFERIGWKHLVTPDGPGFIAARIIAMIINEAWFAYGEEISSKEEIDIAMKLGTNYPYGPFEWAEKIGLHNIYDLLKVLYKTEARYKPALMIEKEIANTYPSK